MKIDIRKAAPEDVRALSRVINETWRSDYREFLSETDLAAFTSEQRRNESFLRLFESGADIFCVMVDGEISGVCTSVKAEESWLSDYCEIMQLYILPEHQRIGLGRKLLSYTLRAMRKKGYKYAYLWVIQENTKGRSFYEKFGFEANGIVQQAEGFSKPVNAERYSIEL